MNVEGAILSMMNVYFFSWGMCVFEREWMVYEASERTWTACTVCEWPYSVEQEKNGDSLRGCMIFNFIFKYCRLINLALWVLI